MNKFSFLSLFCVISNFAFGTDYNQMVVDAVSDMPLGLGYSQNNQAGEAIQKGLSIEGQILKVNPELVTPNYCSGATYLVFMTVIAKLQKSLGFSLDILQGFLTRGQEDGTDSWGRWNANGPGTARFFHETGAGRNFTSFEEARPGDFLKIFWNEHIGKLERGHSVVFLGREFIQGEEYIKFWSSNAPEGFSLRSIPRSRIIRAVFSRLENPKALETIVKMPKSDPYLASLLTHESNEEEMFSMIGIPNQSDK